MAKLRDEFWSSKKTYLILFFMFTTELQSSLGYDNPQEVEIRDLPSPRSGEKPVLEPLFVKKFYPNIGRKDVEIPQSEALGQRREIGLMKKHGGLIPYPRVGREDLEISQFEDRSQVRSGSKSLNKDTLRSVQNDNLKIGERAEGPRLQKKLKIIFIPRIGREETAFVQTDQSRARGQQLDAGYEPVDRKE